MALALVAEKPQHIARPLKVLIPLIQGELQLGNDAGREHYTAAGRMLNEARGQVAHGGWGKWLDKNFHLGRTTAHAYMAWADYEDRKRGAAEQMKSFNSMRELTGHTERDRETRQSKQQQDFRRTLREVARDDFVQERQTRTDEIALHRELAEELVDLGYRALATRLHPDRGGSKDAMSRLNRVREELRQFAQTRRFL